MASLNMAAEQKDYLRRIDEACAYLEPFVAKDTSGGDLIAVVLGSGLGVFAEKLSNAQVIPYADIPGFPTSTVVGHAGQLVIGRAGGRRIIAQQGRVHLYEGWSAQDVCLPARVLTRLGVSAAIVTNAAGGLNPGFAAGDLMLISDHLNLTGASPLTGSNLDDFGPRFPDMSDGYASKLREAARSVAKEIGIQVKEGVYAGMLGPSYETPAEIRMLGHMGADAVGMSTVLESVALVHGGVRVLGISCITNLAAGISATPLNHEEVTAVGRQVATDFVRLLNALVPAL
jgi:purine-nucleoside phosphorylase